jgi:hypothetical protein
MHKKLTFNGLEDQVIQYRYELASGDDQVNKTRSSVLSGFSHHISTPAFVINELNKNENELSTPTVDSSIRYFNKFNLNQQFVHSKYRPNLLN